MLSIIIPTLNEEKYLSRLLDSIEQQSYSDYEVIIADANSTDRTQEIAKRFGAKIVSGGMPAVGRNAGAQVACGEFLLFLDADVVTSPDFFKNVYEEMQERYLDLATCEIVPDSDNEIDKLLHGLTNLFIQVSQYTNPHAPGFCILVTKRLFERIQGFDESLTMAEDHDFVKRASQFRPLRVLNSASINASVRRLEKEGRISLARKYIKVELYRMFIGEPQKNIIDYEFGDFSKEESEDILKWTQRTSKKIKNLKENITSFSLKYKLPEDYLTDNYKKVLSNLTDNFEKIKNSLPNILRPK